MLSHLESLWADLKGVERAIERLETCPHTVPNRWVMEVATLKTARSTYWGVKRQYSASMLEATKPRPEVPENASTEWYYHESKAMLERLSEKPLN